MSAGSAPFLLPPAGRHWAAGLNVRGEILDVGCGEGWYSAALAQKLGLPLTGLDISKEAVRCAAAKYKNARWLCATAAHIPVPDETAGLLMSLFAVTLPEEFCRVLRKDGYFFQVLAAEVFQEPHTAALSTRQS